MKALFFLFILTVTCSALTPVKNLAISDLDGRGLQQDQAQIISDRLRNEVVSLGKVRLMERSMMQSLLQEQGFAQSGACDNAECQIQVGRILGVDYLVVGSVGLLGSLYTINIRILSVETAEIIKSFNLDQKGDIEDLIGKPLRGLADQIVNSLIPPKSSEVANSTPPTATAMPATPSEQFMANEQAKKAAEASAPTVKEPRTWRFWTRIGTGVGAAIFSTGAVIRNRNIQANNTDIETYSLAYQNATTADEATLYRNLITETRTKANDNIKQRNASIALAVLCAAGFSLTFAF